MISGKSAEDLSSGAYAVYRKARLHKERFVEPFDMLEMATLESIEAAIGTASPYNSLLPLI